MHRRKLLLGLIVLITVILGFFAARIELKTNFKDLLSSSEPVMRAYDRMRENCPYSSSIFIVLEGGSASDLTRASDELAARLHKDTEWVGDVQWREDMDFLRKHSLILQKPEDLEKTEKTSRITQSCLHRCLWVLILQIFLREGTPPNHYSEVRTVDGISFSVPRASVFTLLGPNGAGKTTMEILEGIRDPDSGEITVFGDRVKQRVAHN